MEVEWYLYIESLSIWEPWMLEMWRCKVQVKWPKPVLFKISSSNAWSTESKALERSMNMVAQWLLLPRVVIILFMISVVAVRVLCCGLKLDWYGCKMELVVRNSLSWQFIEDFSHLAKQDNFEMGLWLSISQISPPLWGTTLAIFQILRMMPVEMEVHHPKTELLQLEKKA